MLIGDMYSGEIFRLANNPVYDPDPALYEVVESSKEDPSAVTCKYIGTVSKKIQNGYLIDFPEDELVVNLSDYNEYLKELLS